MYSESNNSTAIATRTSPNIAISTEHENEASPSYSLCEKPIVNRASVISSPRHSNKNLNLVTATITEPAQKRGGQSNSELR